MAHKFMVKGVSGGKKSGKKHHGGKLHKKHGGKKK
jgi:hypothetical protein